MTKLTAMRKNKKRLEHEHERLIIPGSAAPRDLIRAIQTIRPLLDANKNNWGLDSVFLHDVHESLPVLDGFTKILNKLI
jgi:hypothetical protein